MDTYESLWTAIVIFNQLCKQTTKTYLEQSVANNREYFYKFLNTFLIESPETLNELSDRIGLDETIELLISAYRTLLY